jgi:hypothetical protein
MAEGRGSNCKPAYFSVMNYLYQLRGLLDDFGRPHLDLSRDVLDPAVNEGACPTHRRRCLPPRLVRAP